MQLGVEMWLSILGWDCQTWRQRWRLCMADVAQTERGFRGEKGPREG